MEPDELAGLPLDWPTDGLRPTRMTVAYEYGGAASDEAITGGLLVPLPGEATPSGTVVALWRGADAPEAAAFAMVAEIAGGATIPIDNARRHRGALANAEIDALTRLYNRRYFHEMLAREISRTQRYGRRLTVAILDVDGFKALNERLGHLACDEILASIGASIRAAVRTSDVACRVGGDEFGVILTEAAATDAEHFFQRLRFALNAEARDERLTLSAGAAELRSDDDSVKVFERADAALFNAKQSGRDQLALADNEQGLEDSRMAEESA
jgi:diguanylate cyclase (GGDEF)-like protein